MVNIEEQSRTLNFQRFHFPMEFPLKMTFNNFLWNEGPYVMALFVVHEAAEFPIVLLPDTQIVCCNVAWDKLGKLFFVENFLPLNLAILMILFCENDKRTPMVIKLDCCTDKWVLFLEEMKT